MVDATIVKVHRHGQGAGGDSKPSDWPLERRHDHQNQRSPMRSATSCASCFCRDNASTRSACRRSEELAFDALIADDAFDSNAIIARARRPRCQGPYPRRAKPLAIDEETHKWLHMIENFFGKLKEFKPIAMRADKTDQSFASMIHLAAAVINSR
jgi:transposase